MQDARFLVLFGLDKVHVWISYFEKHLRLDMKSYLK